MKLTQPLLGLLTTLLIVGASLALCLLMSPATLNSWVTLFVVAMIPSQIVLCLGLQANHPASLAKLAQPWRGIGFTAMNAAIGLAIAYLVNSLFGGGMTPPTPFAIIFLIMTVPVAIHMVAALQCWPFTAVFPDRPLALGASTVGGVYVVTAILFWGLCSFEFLKAAPFYRAELDPHGPLPPVVLLSLLFTAVVVILSLVLLDFWPVCKLFKLVPALSRQPWSGAITLVCAYAVTAAAWATFVTYGGMDPMAYQMQIAVGTIFGLFILLVLFEGAPFIRIPQPARGIVLVTFGIALGIASYWVHSAFFVHVHHLQAGPPGYDLETAIASAMYSLSFALMPVWATYFGFWLLRRTTSGHVSPQDAPDGVANV